MMFGGVYQASVANAKVSADSISALPSAGASSLLAVNMEETVYATMVSSSDTVVTAAADASQYGYTNLGIVQVDSGNLNVRSEADASSSMVGKMTNNSACEILEQVGDFYHITSGEIEGYIAADYVVTGEEALAIAESVVGQVAYVSGDGVNVRSVASTDSEIIGRMNSGSTLEVEADLGDWIQVFYDDTSAYVSADYVEIKTELTTAMTMAEARYGMGVSEARVDLVNYATSFVGNPYVWGGTSLTHGADCSGFVLSIYAKYGISLPHSSSAQSNYGTRISASEAQPGDLFFYGSGRRISHVAIYIGNGQIVHASSRKTGIKISNAYYRTPICVTRLLSD